MKVAQITKAGADFQIVEREIPEPAVGQVRIKVQAQIRGASVKSLEQVLQEAGCIKVAVGYCNFSEQAAFNVIVSAAYQLSLPISVRVSEGKGAFIGVRQCVALVKIREESGEPIYLNPIICIN
jgi:hypothetical protein